MAVAINDSDTYDSGSGGFLSSHSFPDIDCSGSDTYSLAVGINRNPLSDVSGWTFEGNTPDDVINSINTNVVAISVKGDIVSNAALSIVCSTPSFKLQAGVNIAFTGVDQSTPIAGTAEKTSSTFGSTGTLAYTGTSGNLLVVFVSTQNDKTFTASNCTQLQAFSGADSNMGSVFVGYVTATGSSQTIGATWSGGDNMRVVIVEVAASAGGGSEYTEEPADTPSVGDAVAIEVTKSNSDTPSVTDAIAKLFDANKADTSAATDATAKEASKAAADSASTSDIASKLAGVNKADGGSAADAATRASGKRPSDGVTATGAQSKVIGQTIANTALAADIAAKYSAKSLADSASVADEAEAMIILVANINDSVNASDNLTKAIEVLQSETISASALAAAMDIIATKADGVVVIDSADPGESSGLSRSPADSLAVADSVVIQLQGQLFWFSKNQTAINSENESAWFTKNQTDYKD